MTVAADLATLERIVREHRGRTDGKPVLKRVEAEIARLESDATGWQASNEALTRRAVAAEAEAARLERENVVLRAQLTRTDEDSLAEAARLRDGLRDLTNEINCRVEHGVGGVAALHLQYVENKLRALLAEDGAA